MKVTYKLQDDKLTFYLQGELDEQYAKGVKEYIECVLAKTTCKSVVFNMKDLTFMDSTGIGMLLGRYKVLNKQGVACYIDEPTIPVEKVLELSGIYEVIKRI